MKKMISLFVFIAVAAMAKPDLSIVLDSSSVLRSGEVKEFPEQNCMVKLEPGGRLVMQEGSKNAPGKPLWFGGYAVGDMDCFATLQSDGNLVIYRGTPEEPGIANYATGSVSEPGEYVLGINVQREMVIVRKPDVEIWSNRKDLAEGIAEPLPSFPDEKLPRNIRRLTYSGQRADISHDGKKVVYLTCAGGEVEEIEIATGKVRKLTDYPHRGLGFFRAQYLPNGDFFITAGRDRNQAYAYVMSGKDTSKLTPLNVLVREGAAVSRNFMKIAWTPDMQEMWVGEIVYKDGVPELANKKMLFSNDHGKMDIFGGTSPHIEPQNFRPPEETELIWNAYAYSVNGEHRSSESFGWDVEKSVLTENYTKSKSYEEAEGIFPCGNYTLVESDAHSRSGTKGIDIYKLALDGSGKKERLTFFNDVEGYRASNPVVSDDASFMVFQEARVKGVTGHGIGFFVYEFGN